MNNRKYFPFERNSYYFGKLLTARDFEAEQRYSNDKRRLGNRLGGANGIVAGLGVIRADDVSVVVQAGCAYDASGREIVVSETRVVKLSTIDGYSELTSSRAYLGISYQEQPADKVYAAMAQESAGEDCYNKIREEYRLMLMDEAQAARIERPIDAYVTRQILYSDGDAQVIQYVPRFVPLDSNLCIRVELLKTGPGTGEYSFCYELNTPNFVNPDGGKKISVEANNVRLSGGEKKTLAYTLTPETHIWGGGSEVAITASEFTIQKNGEVYHLKERFELLVKPVNAGLEEFYLQGYYSRAMDKQLEESYDERLWIARLDLIRQNAQIILDSVSPPPYLQYSYNAQQLFMLRQLERYYPGGMYLQAAGGKEPVQFPESFVTEPQGALRNTACGVFDLGIGLGHDQREAVFSNEIMHGLGKGPVYVEVGVEYINVDSPGEESSEIFLGDTSIFSKEDPRRREERIYQLSTAVKVLPERGTFVVGLRTGETTGLISLRIRWYAFRLNEVDKQFKKVHDGQRYILINPDTIVLAPKGTAHISPVFINMPTEACKYRLLDAEGGSIDNNGVYTAPAKEGVYEIRVEAISDPTIFTHAFAIVSQKKKEG